MTRLQPRTERSDDWLAAAAIAEMMIAAAQPERLLIVWVLGRHSAQIEGLSLTEVARRFGSPPGEALHVLEEVKAAGFVLPHSATRRWALTPKGRAVLAAIERLVQVVRHPLALPAGDDGASS
jgi:hypothetical protein